MREVTVGDSKLQREIRERDRRLRESIGRSVRAIREDAALTRTAVAEAAGIDRSFVGRIEAGAREPSLSTLVAMSTVLGADLSVKLYPTTGPMIRDHIQAAMVESFLRAIDRRWTASAEVPVYRPVRGVIDVVVVGRREPLVIASEFNSELRRLEQQVRWHREKEESLPSADPWRFVTADEAPATSRLLVLRSTRMMRELARTFERTLRSAYPARAVDAFAALTSPTAPWSGPAIVWMTVDGPQATLLDRPPRGVSLGR
jgi:transcriptional regulator with XRE-family HTH domain